MAVKAFLASLEGLSDSDKAHYKPREGGGFFLDVTGLEDGAAETHPAVAALVSAKKHENLAHEKTRRERDAAQAEAKTLKEKFEGLSTEFETKLKGGMSKEDVARLEQSHNDKLARVTAEKDAEIKRLDGALVKVLVDKEALALASALVKDPAQHAALLAREIRPRLAVEVTGEDAKTRVLDKDGKPSAATLDDLRKEISGNPAYAVLLMGSQASGGGAAPSSASGGAAPAETEKVIADLNADPAKLAGALKAKRAAAA